MAGEIDTETYRLSATAIATRSASSVGRALSGMEAACRLRLDDAKFVVTGTAPACFLPAKKINLLPAGFVVPLQPVTPKSPVGTDWVHEIKHDGQRIIVRRDGPAVRLYRGNTNRPAAIAAAAELIKAKSFTFESEAVMLGPDGLPRFEELSRREAAPTALLYAFDLMERDGQDLCHPPVHGPEAGAGATTARC